MLLVLPATAIFDLRASLTLVARVRHGCLWLFGGCRHDLETTGDLYAMVEVNGGEGSLNRFLENLANIFLRGTGFGQ